MGILFLFLSLSKASGNFQFHQIRDGNCEHNCSFSQSIIVAVLISNIIERIRLMSLIKKDLTNIIIFLFEQGMIENRVRRKSKKRTASSCWATTAPFRSNVNVESNFRGFPLYKKLLYCLSKSLLCRKSALKPIREIKRTTVTSVENIITTHFFLEACLCVVNA